MPRTKKTEEVPAIVGTKSQDFAYPKSKADKTKKPAVKKEPVKQAKTTVQEEVSATKPKVQRPTTKDQKLAIDVYNLEGKVIESLTLPEEIFGGEINQKLIAQA